MDTLALDMLVEVDTLVLDTQVVQDTLVVDKLEELGILAWVDRMVPGI